MKKYCPYTLEFNQKNQTRWEYNADGLMVLQDQILIEQQQPAKCKGRECAAYRWGRCTRK